MTDLEAVTCALRHGSVPPVLAVNPLGEAVSASASAVGRDLLLRGKEHLFCITATE